MFAAIRFFGLRLIAICVAAAFFVTTAIAQTQRSATEQLTLFFYKDPRPERLADFFEQFEKSQASQKWEAYPPIAGFYAIVFRNHPTQIQRLVPTRLNPKAAAAVIAASRLSGDTRAATALQSKFGQETLDEKLKTEFAGLPARLEDLRIKSGTHLDIIWGAAFASGNSRFVSMIIDFFAETANLSESTAMDVARTTIAIMGGPKEVLTELRGKYGDANARQIIFAGTALWGLLSNSREHEFVAQTVSKYIQDRSGTPAAKALSVMQRPPKRT